MPNFFATFIEVLQDREPEKDWELEPGVTCGDYLFGMLQVGFQFYGPEKETRLKQCNFWLQGTRSALYAQKRESVTLTLPSVSPATVGAVIALYERAVGLYASLINVNAYHQPGSQASSPFLSLPICLMFEKYLTLSFLQEWRLERKQQPKFLPSKKEFSQS